MRSGSGSTHDRLLSRGPSTWSRRARTSAVLTATPTGHHGADGDALTGIRGQVNVTIPLTTAAGVDEQPALLSGYGPVDTDLARCLMAEAPAWNLVLIDISTGAPVAVTRYRPSAEAIRADWRARSRRRSPAVLTSIAPWPRSGRIEPWPRSGRTEPCSARRLNRAIHWRMHPNGPLRGNESVMGQVISVLGTIGAVGGDRG